MYERLKTDGCFFFLCQMNKLRSVSSLRVCPLIDDKLRHNIVKVAVEPRAAGEWFRSKL